MTGVDSMPLTPWTHMRVVPRIALGDAEKAAFSRTV